MPTNYILLVPLPTRFFDLPISLQPNSCVVSKSSFFSEISQASAKKSLMMLKHLLLVIVAKTQAPDRIDTGLKARITEFSCTAERHGVLESSGVQTANGNLK